MVYPYKVKFGGKYYAAGEYVPDDKIEADLSVVDVEAVNSTSDTQNVEIGSKLVESTEKKKTTAKAKKK